MESMMVVVWVFLGVPTILEAFNCRRGCDFSASHPVVTSRDQENLCLLTIPDNPLRILNNTQPCQIEIQTNCTTFCKVHLHFHKFNIDFCHQNFSENDHVCSQVDRCEYLIVREHGVTESGVQLDEVVRFHGNRTEDVYVSQTDRLLLQFCYRSETFSARNMQVTYRALDPSINKGINWGPPAVYVMGTFVVLFIIAIFMVQFCPWLRPCLDPPPQKETLMMDL